MVNQKDNHFRQAFPSKPHIKLVKLFLTTAGNDRSETSLFVLQIGDLSDRSFVFPFFPVRVCLWVHA